MHKGVILLTQATDYADAIDLSEQFLDMYKDDVYDHYSIGGRWRTTLVPLDKKKKFSEWITESGIDTSAKCERQLAMLQLKWEQLGLRGLNPYANNVYDFEYNNSYVVVPLSECINEVKAFSRNSSEKGEMYWKLMIEEKLKEDERKKNGMYYNKKLDR